MKKSIITIAGAIGSGKSSTAKRVAKELGYDHFSSGDLFRAIAAERGLSVEDLNRQAESQKEIDRELDALLEKMGAEQDEFVIDSRLAFHWMPQAFKVFLDLDPDTAAERIFTHLQEEGRLSQTASSVEEVRKNIDMRVASERKRYRDLYSIDATDTSPFDLVINTAQNNLDEVVSTTIEAYRTWQEVSDT